MQSRPAKQRSAVLVCRRAGADVIRAFLVVGGNDSKPGGLAMTVLDVVRMFLKVKGYDGLARPGECGCEIGDLAPCGEDFSMCEPAHRTECRPDECTADGDCDWHMTAGKRPH